MIDLGPEGGGGGGRVVAEGTPEQVAAVSDSYTGEFLRGRFGPRVTLKNPAEYDFFLRMHLLRCLLRGPRHRRPRQAARGSLRTPRSD